MEQITMTIEELDRLLALADGDAALVFLSGKRGREPSLGEMRLLQARKKLAGAGMAPSSFTEYPSYSQKEIAQGMLTNPAFHAVADETERVLGKALSPSDLQRLYTIYHRRGLPPSVILLLLHYCAGEQERRARPLTLTLMDKEAAVWEREGLFEEETAELYIHKREASREMSSRVFKSLGIFGREPSATEKNYVGQWLALGFTVEAVALAYDKTVVNTGKLAWGYCDKILRRWHEKGWHTPEQIEAYDKKPPPAKGGEVTGSYDRTREALKRVKGE
ncbi:MAG: DnaD domain protein [Oscillospiraceae bacterium]|jgi:DnaD/phage-associated family protein|nr:DnaD domain protein [Oscillospiraceae bacterium]